MSHSSAVPHSTQARSGHRFTATGASRSAFTASKGCGRGSKHARLAARPRRRYFRPRELHTTPTTPTINSDGYPATETHHQHHKRSRHTSNTMPSQTSSSGSSGQSGQGYSVTSSGTNSQVSHHPPYIMNKLAFLMSAYTMIRSRHLIFGSAASDHCYDLANTRFHRAATTAVATMAPLPVTRTPTTTPTPMAATTIPTRMVCVPSVINS